MVEKTEMKNFKSEKLYNMVYQELRDYIVANNLKSGDKLPPEMTLCEMLGVSRNVLREALKALQIMGVINPVPGIGNVIQTFNFDTIYENVFFYLIPHTEDLIIETFQINAAIQMQFFDEAFDKMTEDDITKLHEIYLEMEQKILNKQRMTEPDRRFHYQIFYKIENRMFHSIENITWKMRPDIIVADQELYWKFTIKSLENHKRLFEALKRRDKESARKELTTHFSNPPVGPFGSWTVR